jgi:hypothetical protein
MPAQGTPGWVPPIGPPSLAGLEVNLTHRGEVHGNGGTKTLDSIGKIVGGLGQIANFLSGIFPPQGGGGGGQ